MNDCSQRWVHTYKVIKKNKHLFLQCVETGELVYSPPNFLRLTSRQDLQDLGDELTAGREFVEAVTAFEKHFHPRRRQIEFFESQGGK